MTPTDTMATDTMAIRRTFETGSDIAIVSVPPRREVKDAPKRACWLHVSAQIESSMTRMSAFPNRQLASAGLRDFEPATLAFRISRS